MILHGIQNLYLHGYQFVKIHLFLHNKQRKSNGFYTIARPIFWKSYIFIHDGFFGLSGLQGKNFRGWAYGIR